MAGSSEIDRCDCEIARINREGEAGLYPAWLIALASEDWEAEKRLILEELNDNL